MADLGASLPQGIVTFLFTDIEGSTRLVQDLGTPKYREVLEAHHQLVRAAIRQHGGVERGTQGDSFLVVFADPATAVAAAAEMQKHLAAAEWPGGVAVRVRMGLHTGQASVGGDDYVGVEINRAARIAAVANGGQVLLSDATRALVERALPPGVSVRDLGEHRLKDLDAPEHVYQLEVPGMPTTFPPLRSVAGPGGPRPMPTTRLIGRERERAEIRRLLGETRLLTLVGPSGTGKTRLMLAIAEEPDPRFPDGSFLVELAPVADPSVVAATIAGALGVRQVGGKPADAVLADHLRGRRVRLLIDNFEHVIGAAVLIDELLRSSPGLQVVVTSQVHLQLSSEQLYPVPPLSLPENETDATGSDAVRLFVERAAQARPDFRLTAENAGEITAICRRLDGLPLAIELAAARVTILPLGMILKRLDNALSVLESRRADVAERHRTLRAAMDWSYRLLGREESAVFRRLSVFVGGGALDAVEAVAGAAAENPLAVLEGLVRHSLVIADTSGPSPRFRMLETIREFAAEQLSAVGDFEETRGRHAAWYRDLAEAQEPGLALLHPDAAEFLEPEIENLNAALRWAMDSSDMELGARICAAAWRLWKHVGHLQDGYHSTRTVADWITAEIGLPYRIHLLAALGSLAYWLGDWGTMRNVYWRRLELAEESGDLAEIAPAHFDRVFAAASEGDPLGIEREWRAARDAYAALGHRLGLARCEWIETGMLAFQRGDNMNAGHLENRVLPVIREEGDLLYVGMITGALAWDALARGELARGREWGRESVATYDFAGDVSSAIVTLDGAALVLRAVGKPEAGAQVQGAAEALMETFGLRTPPSLALQLEHARQGVTVATLDDAEEERLRSEGRRMTLKDAIALFLREA